MKVATDVSRTRHVAQNCDLFRTSTLCGLVQPTLFFGMGSSFWQTLLLGCYDLFMRFWTRLDGLKSTDIGVFTSCAL